MKLKPYVSGEKPYVCSICGFRTNVSWYLRRHQATHEGGKTNAPLSQRKLNVKTTAAKPVSSQASTDYTGEHLTGTSQHNHPLEASGFQQRVQNQNQINAIAQTLLDSARGAYQSLPVNNLMDPTQNLIQGNSPFPLTTGVMAEPMHSISAPDYVPSFPPGTFAEHQTHMYSNVRYGSVPMSDTSHDNQLNTMAHATPLMPTAVTDTQKSMLHPEKNGPSSSDNRHVSSQEQPPQITKHSVHPVLSAVPENRGNQVDQSLGRVQAVNSQPIHADTVGLSLNSTLGPEELKSALKSGMDVTKPYDTSSEKKVHRRVASPVHVSDNESHSHLKSDETVEDESNVNSQDGIDQQDSEGSEGSDSESSGSSSGSEEESSESDQSSGEDEPEQDTDVKMELGEYKIKQEPTDEGFNMLTDVKTEDLESALVKYMYGAGEEKAKKTPVKRKRKQKGESLGDEERFCKICGSYVTGYLEHLKTHKEGKRFKCPQCPKTFSRSHGIHNHMLTHTGERPHLCYVCGASFKLKDSLREHTARHQVQCKTLITNLPLGNLCSHIKFEGTVPYLPIHARISRNGLHG